MTTVKKGLNVPDTNKYTVLDSLFSELERFLEVDEKSTQSALIQLYNKCSSSGKNDTLGMVEVLIDHCFNYFDKMQQLSIEKKEAQANNPEKSNLITISLHDMQYFNALLNVIIVQLIYPLLPSTVGIPLEKRRLKSFIKRTKLFQYQHAAGEVHPTMLKIISRFQSIFDKAGDVKELMVKASGLTDVLILLMVLIHEYDPSLRQLYLRFEEMSDTYNLFGIYIALLQTTRQPEYKAFLSSRLTSITICKSNGLVSLIDFIVGIRDNEEVNIDKFNHVNRILMSKPKDLTSVEYFTMLFDQIYDVLIYINRPILLSVVVNFIRVLYDRNRRIVQDFLFKRIWKIWNPSVYGFNQRDTIVSEKQLNDVTNVLISLTKESSEDFLNDLFSQVILPLWCYYFYLKKRKLEYSSIVSNILVSFFTITSNNEYLKTVISNMINQHGEGWIFSTTLENKLTSMVKSSVLEDTTNFEILEDIDLGLDIICDLLSNLSNEVVRSQFLVVLNRWILKQGSNELDETNPFIMLIDLKFLERVNEKFKESLMDRPEEMLFVIQNLLSTKFEQFVEQEDNGADSDDEDDENESDGIIVLLELLSAIISETAPPILMKYQDTLRKISSTLGKRTSDRHSMALKSRIEDLLKGDYKIGQDDAITRDKDLFEKAITNINDPLVPIRAHGLYLLRQLIMKKSPVLSLQFALDLHMVQLQDQEPFIYMNVIKSLNELIEFDSQGTIEFLITFYLNKKEILNDRLKVGEVIIHFIDRQGELLVGSLVDQLISMILTVIRDFEEDERLRMSSMSLLGEALRTNARGIEPFNKDALDCSIGVLEMEHSDIMKRAAVVLIGDLLAFGGLDVVPKGYGIKIQRVLDYERVKCTDYLLMEQIDKVKSIVEELKRDKLTLQAPHKFDKLRI
jgi:hypothetical protein